MNRREVLLGGVALAGAALASRAQAAEMKHDHHHYMSVNAALVSAAADCVQKRSGLPESLLISFGPG